MRCEDCRETISARLDGETGPSEPREVAAHLAGCAPCRRFEERAAAVTRAARTRVAETTPDLVDVVMAAPLPTGRRLRSVLQMALGGAGIAQLGLAIADLTQTATGAHDGPRLVGAAATHLAHESAAWSFALGVGFLWVACGGRGRGLVPVVGVFVGGLALLSVADVLAGTVGAHRLTTHLVAVFGLLALLAVQRSAPRDDGGRGGTRRGEPTQPVGEAPWPPVAGIPHDPAA